MTNEYSSKAEAIIDEVLAGIDKDETESDDGWWETSTGAEFGLNKKKELLQAITDLITQAQIDARIDELEMIDSRGELYAPYIKKRYDELQSTLKKEQ